MRKVIELISTFVLMFLLTGCGDKNTREEFDKQYHNKVSSVLKIGEDSFQYQAVVDLRIQIKPNEEIKKRQAFIIKISVFDGEADAFNEEILTKYYEINPNTTIDETIENLYLHKHLPDYRLTIVDEKGQDYIKDFKVDGITINFDSQGGTAISCQILRVGQQITKPNDPQKEGLKFLYWTLSLDNPTPFSFSTPVSKDITLYAFYEEKINLELNYCDNITQKRSVSQTIDLKYDLPTPTRKGYLFQGWYADESYNKLINSSTTVTREVTKLYAKWKIEEYSINFIVENEVQKNNNVYEYNVETETITLNDATKTGYTFKGWYKNEQLSGSPIKIIPKGSVGDLKLYPKFAANVYDVTLIFDEDPEGESQTIKATYDDFYKGLPTPIKEGFIFEGWYKEKDNYSSLVEFESGNQKYYVDNKVNTPFNHSLYAKWVEGTSGLQFVFKENSWEVKKYNGNNSEILIPQRITGLLVSSIGENAFKGLSAIQTITIPEGVTHIGNSAFEGLSLVQTIIIPDGVTSIGDSAFAGNIELTSIVIPSSVKTIGTSAFSGSTNISVLTLNSGLTTIGDYAFKDLAITSIIIPDSVTTIGKGAFQGCNTLESITLPFVGKSKTATAYEAVFGYIFGYETGTKVHGASSLESVSTEFVNTKYGTQPAGTTWQYTCLNYKTQDPPYDYNYRYYPRSYYYYIPQTLKSVTITDANTISEEAFINCVNITNITLNDGLTSIGNNAFSNMTNLTTINIPINVINMGTNVFKNMNSSFFINCKVDSMPAEWSETWNSDNYIVNWGV